MSAAAAREALARGGKLTTTQWIGFMAMVLGMFMAILDIQIVASSLSQVQAGLSASADEITWVQTSYLVAEVIMIPLSGWLSRAFSTRILFAVSCMGFTLMSLLCALAWNLDSMIVFRALQGFLGGAMIPTVFATIFIMFPREMRLRMNIVLGLVVTLAPTAGPVLGGYLTDMFSWHMMFLINVIPGILVSLAVWFFLDVDKPDHSLLKKIDFRGILYIGIFLGSLQFVLEDGVREDWFNSDAIVIAALLAVFAGIAMFWRELTIKEPIVNLRAFGNANFAVGSLFGFVLGIGLYSAIALMPMYLAQVKGLNSFQIGMYLAVTGGFQLLFTPVAGIASQKLEPRTMLFIGMSGFAASMWLNGLLTNETGFWELFLPQAVRGASLMFCFIPINDIALGTLPVDQIKNASGLFNLMRNLGGAIGLAVISTLSLKWNHFYQGQLREHVTAGNEATQAFLTQVGGRMEQIGVANPDLGALQTLYHVALREASVLTFNDLFHGLAIIYLCSLPLVFLIKKGAHKTEGGGH
ncbi:MAG: DHA2 family efflux MFS transporter permease subunit [Blastochloris viridis]|uniref:DHA2 family efflux MFS transporter permease subunit n=1 Tax=Blastochloris viridis TaxID=1079 RepID=A0A6N4RAF5_BLAVI|nr:MAG: DHA2 family efflux MFS transporter permease subunit [Blastochloris viridis]